MVSLNILANKIFGCSESKPEGDEWGGDKERDTLCFVSFVVNKY